MTDLNSLRINGNVKRYYVVSGDDRKTYTRMEDIVRDYGNADVRSGAIIGNSTEGMVVEIELG